MKELFAIFGILPREQYIRCIGMIIAMVFGALLEAVGIGVVLPLISLLSDKGFRAQYPSVAKLFYDCGFETHTDFIIAVSVLILLLYFLKNLYIVWETRLQIRFSVKHQIYYAKALLAEYLMKPYLFHVDHNTAALIRNVNVGAQTIFAGILVCALQLLTECVTVLMIWGMLIMVDPFTAIVVASAISALLLGIIRAFQRQIVMQGVVKNECDARCIKWLNQGLGAIKETKIMHKEAFFLDEFSKAYVEYGKAQGRFSFLNQIQRNILEVFVVSGLMLLIIVKAWAGENPENIVSLLGVLALAAFRLIPSAVRIMNYVNAIKFQLPLFDELQQELEGIRQHKDGHEQLQIGVHSAPMQFSKEIVVKELGFRFPDTSKNVLENVSFEIHKGAYVGIIGPSGAGKTTFVDILLGLLPPTKGNICVDGKDIQKDLRGWQENLAYVPQSIYLLDATIKENIALGEPIEAIDDERIEKALRMAELYDFVEELPKGINTMVGERGVKLSGGQRQRIGIARALYQGPEILVLDEATSALDNITEKNITDTILKLKGIITIISIAHRVSTLEDCDYKVEFKKGVTQVIQCD